jgi:hypothetical protein
MNIRENTFNRYVFLIFIYFEIFQHSSLNEYLKYCDIYFIKRNVLRVLNRIFDNAFVNISAN